MKHSNQFHHRSKRTFDNLKYADVMKLVDVLDSKSCVGNHVPVRLRPSAYFSYLEKDIMESNRRPVLTSQKMILNHFSRQSGHRHIFFIFRERYYGVEPDTGSYLSKEKQNKNTHYLYL